MKKEKIQKALDSILHSFETGQVGDLVKIATIKGNRPSDQWSLSNRLLMLLSGTVDARGFNQWKQAGRYVRSGARAFHILAPSIKTIKDTEIQIDPGTGDETNIETKKQIFTGFIPVPVFRYEDTNGKPLPEERNHPLPPLADVAERFGLSIKYQGCGLGYLGYYSRKDKTIGLCTEDQHVFFHELAHAVHHHIVGDENWKSGQDPTQEIVADLAATAVAHIFGLDYTANSYQYITHYASGDIHKACLKVLSTVEKIINLIFYTGASQEVAA